jgi:outer membrane lipoprotein-sorting protein
MEKKHPKKWIITCISFFLTALLLTAPCLAAEFTADMTMNAGGQMMQGKVFVKGQNYRQEMDTMGQKQVMIFNGDKGTGWVVMPAAHMYMPMPKYGPGNAAQADPKELEKKATKKYLGKETINGYKCKKYSFVYKDSSGTKMTQWISTKLQYPVKMIIEGQKGRMVRELKNIKETKLSKSLFQLPAGYQKMNIPGMSGSNQ